MRTYLHQLPDWPRFHWQREVLAERLAAVRHQQGRLLGQMQALGFELRQEASVEMLTQDVVKSSEIEGERLDAGLVRSSIARQLGLEAGGAAAEDRHVEGIVAMMLDATGHCDQSLTAERLMGWHGVLFPTGRSGLARIRVAGWRDDSSGPMRMVSGAAGRLDREMAAFLEWLNVPAQGDAVWQAGLAHLWFVTIHPFDDGNGRIARAIADLALARSEQSAQRFYSMSTQIRRERAAYYDVLERTQRGTMDVTAWMEWFTDCLGRAIENAQTTLGGVLAKARFWAAVANVPLNDRQRLVWRRLVDGFEGKLTTSKWGALAKCSQDTALRDILELVERGVLARGPGGGRSTSYVLGPVGGRTEREG